MLDLFRRRALARSSMASGLARLWPGQCAFCRCWCRGPLCEDCEAQHPVDAGPRCALCALRLPAGARATGAMRCGRCASHPMPLSRCVAAMDYVFPWDRLLLGLKFGERLEHAPLLAARLSRAIALAQVEPPDLIVPVPLSTQRLRERGYNQAHEIARRLALPSGMQSQSASQAQRQSRLCALTLMRVRHTDQQAQLPLDERRGNLRGAFAVVKPVHGLRVAIVDDVMTSGATLHEAALALQRAGARDVQAWVVARTP